MANVAYKATISVLGPSTLGSGKFKKTSARNVFQIMKDGHRVIDASRGVDITAPGPLGENVRIVFVNALLGLIRLESTDPENPGIEFFEATLTGTYHYFPATEVLGANSYTVDLTGDVLPSTTFSDARGNKGYMTNTYGLNSVSITLGSFFEMNKTIRKMKQDREKIYIQIITSSGNDSIIGIFIAESINLSGDISSLEAEEFTFQLAGDINTSFSWS